MDQPVVLRKILTNRLSDSLQCCECWFWAALCAQPYWPTGSMIARDAANAGVGLHYARKHLGQQAQRQLAMLRMLVLGCTVLSTILANRPSASWQCCERWCLDALCFQTFVRDAANSGVGLDCAFHHLGQQAQCQLAMLRMLVLGWTVHSTILANRLVPARDAANAGVGSDCAFHHLGQPAQ